MKRQYAEGMIADGTVQLGTLYHYREQEKLGNAIGDEDEGKYDIFSEDTIEVKGDPIVLPDFYRGLLEIGPDIRQARVQDIRFQRTHISPNAYMFCCSSEFSESTMREFGDACVRISDISGFVDEIRKAIQGEITTTIAARCLYLKREFHYTTPAPAPPGFIKDPSYAHQKEVRAVWVPKVAEIQPRILTVPGIRRFCSLHYPTGTNQGQNPGSDP
jgi:hypothetical protein